MVPASGRCRLADMAYVIMPFCGWEPANSHERCSNDSLVSANVRLFGSHKIAFDSGADLYVEETL